MAGHNELGQLGEELAADYLLKHGYTILHRNWVYQKAEIDIIAQKGDTLAIVEVKTRSSLEFGLPQEFVTPAKIKLLVRAVDAYMEMHDIDAEVRFDIASVYKEGKGYAVEHLEDAFYYF